MQLDEIQQQQVSNEISATRGMFWACSSVIIGKCSSFFAQLVLGWLLSKNDFGTYALAISIGAFALPIQNVGVYRLLIKRYDEYDELAPGLFKLALGVNILLMFVLLGLAPLAAGLYKSPELASLLAIVAISIPLNTPGVVLGAKLPIMKRFKANSWVSSATSLVRNLSIVIFALCGFGPLSFVLPLVVAGIFNSVAILYLVREWPGGGRPSAELVREVFCDVKWIVLGSVLLHLGYQGDNLAIGLLSDKSVLGEYFFAYQLSFTLHALLAGGIDSVMMPSFAQLSNEPQRQSAAFAKSLRVLSSSTGPVIVAATALAQPLIGFLWAGKWNAAILPAQMLLLSSLTRLPMYLTQSYLDSKGLWRFKTFIQFFDTTGVVLSAALGAWLGGLLSISISVCLYRLLSGLFFCALGCGRAGLGASGAMREVVPGVGGFLAAGVLFEAGVRAAAASRSPAPIFLLTSAIVLALLAAIVVAQRSRWSEVFAVFKRGIATSAH